MQESGSFKGLGGQQYQDGMRELMKGNPIEPLAAKIAQFDQAGKLPEEFIRFNFENGSLLGAVVSGEQIEKLLIQIPIGGLVPFEEIVGKELKSFDPENKRPKLLVIPVDKAPSIINSYFGGRVKECPAFYKNPRLFEVIVIVNGKKVEYSFRFQGTDGMFDSTNCFTPKEFEALTAGVEESQRAANLREAIVRKSPALIPREELEVVLNLNQPPEVSSLRGFNSEYGRFVGFLSKKGVIVISLVTLPRGGFVEFDNMEKGDLSAFNPQDKHPHLLALPLEELGEFMVKYLNGELKMDESIYENPLFLKVVYRDKNGSPYPFATFGENGLDREDITIDISDFAEMVSGDFQENYEDIKSCFRNLSGGI